MNAIPNRYPAVRDIHVDRLFILVSAQSTSLFLRIVSMACCAELRSLDMTCILASQHHHRHLNACLHTALNRSSLRNSH
jgi:hypothetical protein